VIPRSLATGLMLPASTLPASELRAHKKRFGFQRLASNAYHIYPTVFLFFIFSANHRFADAAF
jgi:hypothetical protein